MKFELLGLNPEILKAVTEKGYKKATPIQEKAVPAILAGRDVLGGAQTGTGKTAAFALPILNKLNEAGKSSGCPRALVLAPTRELADQVCESFIAYGKFLDLKSIRIFGGVKINPQITNLKIGTDIVVATPGRLLDHINQNTIDLSQIEILVLDEADRMLDMGFIRDIKKIIKALPRHRQNLLFSATYGKDIKQLSADVLRNPVSVEVTKRNTAAEKVEQIIYRIEKGQKRYLLAHLIREENWYQVLVFVRTKHGANRLAKQLDKDGIPANAIHSDKSQAARTRAMNSFRKGDLQVLVATDVAARGIDLQDLTHVVNFELPQVPEDYVHRIGRTGRAGKSGTAVTLIAPEDRSQLQKVEKILKYSIPEGHVIGFKPVYDPTAKKTTAPKKSSKRPSSNAAPAKKGGGNNRKFRPKRRTR
ncbi:MAG: DEAD/DEAH box helicase [Spirochaetales bacterium]|uniref:DEAD-box ATP-dependent RNA helicase RhpA n=1 Tax=Candidatus Thalassospirochaeta sargassi TaxID=3119039 RepID=A0AAJ1ICI1_9SPIO|nr:DEAD/DEAH box helicase [Spirochaetales bacterium]